MNLLVDTASPVVWFAGEDCPVPSQCSQGIFQSSESQSFGTTADKYTAYYGDLGYGEGFFSED